MCLKYQKLYVLLLFRGVINISSSVINNDVVCRKGGNLMVGQQRGISLNELYLIRKCMKLNEYGLCKDMLNTVAFLKRLPLF